LAVSDAVPQVDLENVHGHSADRRSTGKLGTLPLKMLGPRLRSRIEKRNGLLRDYIITSDIRALVVVAREASKGKVLRDCRAVMFLGDDVVELVLGVFKLLRHVAVFAAGACPLPNLITELPVHD
jgi:hypothetical protein